MKFLVFLISSLFASIPDYENGTGLDSWPQNANSTVVGFTVIHGSAKSETAEISLIESMYKDTELLIISLR